MPSRINEHPPTAKASVTVTYTEVESPSDSESEVEAITTTLAKPTFTFSFRADDTVDGANKNAPAWTATNPATFWSTDKCFLALSIAVSMVDSKERRGSTITRADFWNTIDAAWAQAGCNARTKLCAAIRAKTVYVGDYSENLAATANATVDDINDAIPAMLTALADKLETYDAANLAAWNSIAAGMFSRLDINVVREAVTNPNNNTDKDWALTRAWAIAVGYDVYVALTANPGKFGGIAGSQCQEIVGIAPEMHERKFGGGLMAFTAPK